MAAQLSSEFQKLVDAKRIPGAGAIVIDKSGKKLYDEAFGKINANDDSSLAFTNETQMMIWSCTKFVTSLCALQLIEQGKLSIDDPVSKYLPEEGDRQVITGFDAEGKPQLRPAQSEMKVIHLFTHTAGHTYDFWESDKLMHDYHQSKGLPTGAYVGLGAEWEFNDVYLAFDPGHHHHYGINIDKLGFIVEKLSGLRLPEYIKQNIADPLGWKYAMKKYDSDNYLNVHIKDGEGALTAVPDIGGPKEEPWTYGGGHYLVSSLSDYSQLMLAMLNGGTHPGTKKQILKPETVQNYVFKDFIPHVGCKPDGIGYCPTSIVPGLSNAGDVAGHLGVDFKDRGWSCGLMTNNVDAKGYRKAGSGAWAGLGNLYYWIDPTSGIAGIIGTGIFPFLDRDALDLFEKVEKFAYSS